MQTMSKTNERMNPPMAMGTIIGWIGCPAMLAGVRMVLGLLGYWIVVGHRQRRGRRGVPWSVRHHRPMAGAGAAVDHGRACSPLPGGSMNNSLARLIAALAAMLALSACVVY